MKSPFPGMDPFIEGHSWEDFHLKFIDEISTTLVALLKPRYLVRVGVRVYLEHASGNGSPRWIGPDAFPVGGRADSEPRQAGGGAGTAVLPVVVTLPMPVEVEEHYLNILWHETMEVVTTIEVLSPKNKSTGRKEYLQKRETVLLSQAHLVELDLLRGGARLPAVGPLPPGDFYAVVSRSERRPRADVYAWTLRHRMPAIPIPLRAEDLEVSLDLQGIFDALYERSDYEYSLDYSRILDPPLHNEDAAWVQELLLS